LDPDLTFQLVSEPDPERIFSNIYHNSSFTVQIRIRNDFFRILLKVSEPTGSGSLTLKRTLRYSVRKDGRK
jgi:hypothetical protein